MQNFIDMIERCFEVGYLEETLQFLFEVLQKINFPKVRVNESSFQRESLMILTNTNAFIKVSGKYHLPTRMPGHFTILKIIHNESNAAS